MVRNRGHDSLENFHLFQDKPSDILEGDILAPKLQDLLFPSGGK